MDNEHMRHCVNRYVEAFAKKDLSIIEELYAEDAVVEDPVGSEPYCGIEAIKGFYEVALQNELKLELTGEVRCAGQSAAFPFKAVVTGLEMHIIDVFEFNADGKVIAMRAYWGNDNAHATG